MDTNVFKQKQDYENLIKQNKSSTIKEDQNWANNAPTDYSFDVNKKYKDKSGREVYFRNDTQAVKFREILNFLKKRSLKCVLFFKRMIRLYHED